MDLSIIIVNYNVYSDVKICIESIYKYINNISFEIIVVDNNSPDRAIVELNNIYKDVKLLLLKDNKGFGSANNAAMKIAKGKFFFLVNPDIIFKDSSSEDMLEYIKNNEKIGAIGPVQIKPGQGIEYYYTFFPGLYSRFAQEFFMYMSAPIMKDRFFKFWDDSIARKVPFTVDWVMGSALMLRNDVFEKTGGLDEAFFLFEEETEWQFRMKKSGWISMIYPGSKVVHNHHSSSGKIGQIFIHFHEFRSRIIFSNKHDRMLKRFLRKIMIFVALFIRIIFNSLKYLLSSNEKVKIKIKVFYALLKFNFRTRNRILQDRFSFADYPGLFSGG